MTVYAIDPGPTKSALVVLMGGVEVLHHEHFANHELLKFLREAASLVPSTVLVVEQIAAMGMAVGADVFETCVWSGRFIEAWSGNFGSRPWARLKRHEIKIALCGSMKAKDPNIRQALIDRFGPGKDIAIGKKKTPGPLYGISGDEWSALAVAVTWWERNRKDGANGISGQR